MNSRNTRNTTVLFFFFAVALLFGGRQAVVSRNLPLPQPSALHKKKVVKMVVTAYDPWDEECVGKWAEGNRRDPARRKKWSKPGVASAKTLLPLGTELWIPGVGYRKVDDTGGDMRKSAKKGIYHIDIRMKSHADAVRFGRRIVLVEILSPKKGSV